jgi:hypothetical protein
MTSGINSETSFANQVHESLEKGNTSNKFRERKVAYSCDHCDIMLISRNLMNEHLQRKHQEKPKNKNYSQIPLWDHSQPCYLCNQNQTYYMSDGECPSMGDKMCIDCIRQNLEYIETLQDSGCWAGSYQLNCKKCQTKHGISLEYGLFLNALSGNIPEQNIIDICD